MNSRKFTIWLTSVFLVLFAFTSGAAWAQSLKTVPVQDPPDLNLYVRDRAAAVQLGKALFWDMQVGSDGVQACATCHFKSGADGRLRNQMNPGQAGGDNVFTAGGPNTVPVAGDFPFHQFANPDFSTSAIVRDNNDVMGSQGVVKKRFVDIVPGSAEDNGVDVADPVFHVGAANVRQVTARNTPQVINAVFNFNNFHDGRAHNVFNGHNPFGPADFSSKIVTNKATGLAPVLIRIRNASLASQATGPPLSDVEMSYAGRTWPKIGKKMLSLGPLAKQLVHPEDSVLGAFSNAAAIPGAKGINTTYEALIQRAFVPKYWNNTTQIVTYNAGGLPVISAKPAGPLTTDQFTQTEANFSFFFGLAVQLYESTLLANDSRFDRFQEGSAALTLQELNGLNTFTGAGGCTICHAGPELTNVAVANLLAPQLPNQFPNPRRNPPNSIEFMPMLDGRAFYDIGYYNIGVSETKEDLGRGLNSPFKNALTGAKLPLSYTKLALLKTAGKLPGFIATYTPSLPVGFLPTDTAPFPGRTDTNGAFKVPHLRNVALTGPYFHIGGAATLRQVVDFYTRQGNHPVENRNNLSPAIKVIGQLRGSPARKNEVVAFLLTLTDDRVANEVAPFDHPELSVPHGADAGGNDIMLQIPAVGGGGRPAEGLSPLGSFMSVNHFRP